MIICHIASHWGVYRGGAVQLSRMAIEQQRRGHSVIVVFSDKYLKNPIKRYKDISSWNFLKEHGVRCKPLKYRGMAGPRRLLNLIEKEKCDIVHVHRNEALLKASIALKNLDIPIIAQRGTISKPDKPHLIKGFRSENVKAIITVADAVKISMLKTIGQDKKNIIHTVYGSVDVESFKPREPDLNVYRKLNIPEKAKIIGSFSSYREAKKIENILYAIKRLLTDDKNIYGVFLGSDLHKTIIPLSKKLGISDNCIFLGHKAVITPYLSIVNVSVVTANGQEGLSGVLRESLAMKIPVISTDCAGNNEIIENNKTGLLIPVDNIDALTRAVKWTFENSKASQKMAENGRKWILGNCTPEVQVNHLDKIYRSV